MTGEAKPRGTASHVPPALSLNAAPCSSRWRSHPSATSHQGRQRTIALAPEPTVVPQGRSPNRQQRGREADPGPQRGEETRRIRERDDQEALPGRAGVYYPDNATPATPQESSGSRALGWTGRPVTSWPSARFGFALACSAVCGWGVCGGEECGWMLWLGGLRCLVRPQKREGLQ